MYDRYVSKLIVYFDQKKYPDAESIRLRSIEKLTLTRMYGTSVVNDIGVGKGSHDSNWPTSNPSCGIACREGTQRVVCVLYCGNLLTGWMDDAI